MKTVVVHGNATSDEQNWAKQFAGLDASVKAQFSTLVDFTIRTPRVFTIPVPVNWVGIVATVSDAARAAGSGGVVIIASGHGGVGNTPEEGIINWDAADGNVDRGWIDGKVGKGLFWDEVIAQYTDRIPHGNPPTRKDEDENTIKNNPKNSSMARLRHAAFDALQQIGKALRDNGVGRLTFTVCTAGSATAFMNRLANQCHTQVACFRQMTAVFDDGNFGQKPGKARLTMESDMRTDGQGTNVLSARVFSPNLDDARIAFVANPSGGGP
jgi:hypothetical protein